MAKILVTGATGRLGANLVKTLLDRKYEVRAFVMQNDPMLEKLRKLDCEIFYGDFLKPDSLEAAVKGCGRVLHMGAVMYRPAGMSETAYWSLNVGGTFALVRACIRNRVKRYVYASTDGTYEATNWEHLPMEETHPQRPASLYGVHKVCGEGIAFEAMREAGLPVAVTRFSSIMVADEILNFFTMRYVLAMVKSSESELCSNVNPRKIPDAWKPIEAAMEDPMQLCIPRGRDYRSWRMHICDVRDTVEGVILAMNSDSAVGEAFNLGWARAVTWEEVVKYIAEKSRRPYTDLCLDAFWEFELSVEKAKRLLGFEARFDYRMMIDDAFRFRAGEDIGVIQGQSYFVD